MADAMIDASIMFTALYFGVLHIPRNAVTYKMLYAYKKIPLFIE